MRDQRPDPTIAARTNPQPVQDVATAIQNMMLDEATKKRLFEAFQLHMFAVPPAVPVKPAALPAPQTAQPAVPAEPAAAAATEMTDAPVKTLMTEMTDAPAAATVMTATEVVPSDSTAGPEKTDAPVAAPFKPTSVTHPKEWGVFWRAAKNHEESFGQMAKAFHQGGVVRQQMFIKFLQSGAKPDKCEATITQEKQRMNEFKCEGEYVTAKDRPTLILINFFVHAVSANITRAACAHRFW